MQRLFSTFAGGWPGVGLLVQRFLIGAVLLRSALLQANVTPHFATIVLLLISSLFLLIGLATPYIGILVAGTQIWLALARAADPWAAIILSGLALSLAMIGPGAWSLDARFFGRKHVEIVKK